MPPLGLPGIEVTDPGTVRDGMNCYGAIGVGGTKMKIHKAAIRHLFESNNQVLDAEEIYRIGQQLIGLPASAKAGSLPADQSILRRGFARPDPSPAMVQKGHYWTNLAAENRLSTTTAIASTISPEIMTAMLRICLRRRHCWGVSWRRGARGGVSLHGVFDGF